MVIVSIRARAEAVAERAEDHAADAPADEEERGNDLGEIGRCPFGEIAGVRETIEREVAREREDALVEAVEEPRPGSDEEDEPVIAGEQPPPRDAPLVRHGRRGALLRGDVGGKVDGCHSISAKQKGEVRRL